MHLYEFNRRKNVQKAAQVWEHGQFLIVRRSGGCSVLLYSMGNFFAEVWYQVEASQVEMVLGFRSWARLDPYAEMIDLAALMH